MTLSYLLLFAFANFPSVYMLDKFGLRNGVIVGILLTAVGLWIRCLINTSFLYCIIGQTLMALG